jgi:peptide deformylase
MARLPVLEYPDYRLRIPAQTVTTFDADLARLADDLLDTMNAAGVIGLSAPQADDRRRVAVIAASHPEVPQIYVNPEIVERHGLGFVRESCLSIPGIEGSVPRSMRIRVRAQDPDGTPFEQELSQMDAVCLQHELDHLNGKLFIDRLFVFRRLFIAGMAWNRQRKLFRARRTAA